MTALGISLIVLGMALLCSGLVFLLPSFVLPTRHENPPPPPQESFKENQERTARYLQEMREERDEP
jgi:hypothetical protein